MINRIVCVSEEIAVAAHANIIGMLVEEVYLHVTFLHVESGILWVSNLASSGVRGRSCR